MKEVTDSLRKRIENGEVTAYTNAWVFYPVTGGTPRSIYLSPNDFTVDVNSYTVNGGYNFPIGNVVSKQIKLSVHNQIDKFYEEQYDLYKKGTYIELYTAYYLNGKDQTPTRINEGTFYISDVKKTAYSITITAYDYVSIMDTPFQIVTAVAPSYEPMYATLWDYFVYLCDEVLAPKLGITAENPHFYATHLDTDRFPNSTMALGAIVAGSKITTTLRDVFGYIAQLAGGNIVITGESYSVGNRVKRLDVVPYKLSAVDFTNAMEFGYDNLPTTDGGEFDEVVTSYTDGGLFNDCFDYSNNNDYIVLDKYQAAPSIEYNDIQYTGVRIKYPIPNSEAGGSAQWVPSSEENILELENPLAQDTTDGSTKVRQAAHRIFSAIQQPIRPFNGSFINNPLIEFMDRVIVVDVDGTAYNSFVGEHTLNYLGMSNIANRTPTREENNRKYL